MSRTNPPPTHGSASSNAEAEHEMERDLAMQAAVRASDFQKELTEEIGGEEPPEDIAIQMARAEHVRGLKDLTPKIPTLADEKAQMKWKLEQQPTFRVTLPQNPPNFPQLGRWFGSINGYAYQISRDEPTDVPESVYLLLVQQRVIPPQRKEDKAYIDAPAIYPIDTHGSLTEQVNKGLITGANLL